MPYKQLSPQDAAALQAMTPETQAVIYYALKSLRHNVTSNVFSLVQNKKMSAELMEYYSKIELHSQSLTMVLDAQTQVHTMSNL